MFSIDINKIIDLNIGVKFDSLFESIDGQQPMIVQMWMQEDITLETVVILNSILGFIQQEDSKISDTIIWPDNKRKIEKYTPFVSFDINKCKTVLMEKFA